MKVSWDDCDVWTQAMIISYHQIREIEEMDEKIEFAKATMRVPGL